MMQVIVCKNNNQNANVVSIQFRLSYLGGVGEGVGGKCNNRNVKNSRSLCL